jgi:hypothetical protein
MAAPLTDEQIVEAYREHGTQRKAAEALGIAQSTVSGRLAVAAARGLLGTSPVLPGFRIAKVSNTPQGDWVQQRPDLGEPLEPPEGMEHKRVSALSSGDGRLIQKWDIYEKEPKSRQLLVEAIKTAFDGYTGRAELTPAPLVSRADLATIYQQVSPGSAANPAIASGRPRQAGIDERLARSKVGPEGRQSRVDFRPGNQRGANRLVEGRRLAFGARTAREEQRRTLAAQLRPASRE